MTAILAVVGVLAVSAIIYLAARESAPSRVSTTTSPSFGPRKVTLPAIPRRPRPATMAPERYSDPNIRKSYEIAKNNPDLLEKMACYCGCYQNPGHTNNLDCFVDAHGET